ncbi:ABC transporter ATPase [Streptococcus pneumoniae]|nr:ABC transporter ATPase [Streptococcus pneumoniae]
MAEQDLAMQVLQQVVKLPVVKVDRSKFLVDKFSKELGPQDIPTLLEQGPTSLLSQEILDRVANACIRDNVLLASGTSVLAGLPGGLAMAITIPAYVAQFYGFSLKLAQELGYIYGYEDLWASREELSEDAQNTLLLYLGVMLGVNGTAALFATCWWYNNCQTDNENSA